MTTTGAPSDERFAFVESNYDRIGASPSFEEGESGLRISAPGEVRVSKKPRIPLACALRISADEGKKFGPVDWSHVYVVVMREDGLFATVGRLGLMPAPPPAPPADYSDEPTDPADEAIPLFESEVIGGWRNVDLSEQVKWPPGPGVFHVFVLRGPFQSNSVRIELVENR